MNLYKLLKIAISCNVSIACLLNLFCICFQVCTQHPQKAEADRCLPGLHLIHWGHAVPLLVRSTKPLHSAYTYLYWDALKAVSPPLDIEGVTIQQP